MGKIKSYLEIRKQAREIAKEIEELKRLPNFYSEINKFIKAVS